MPQVPSFYEFFAGGGMARAGLGEDWHCRFANDFDPRKCSTYQANWGDREIVCGDVRSISISDLPAGADLAWASFPCQDLSLAGGGAGLKGNRSGTFWPFWDLVSELNEANRAPDLIVLENVIGTLTSHAGADFQAICSAVSSQGYRFGALVVDAALFLPHSRPRLFVVGVRETAVLNHSLVSATYSEPWHSRSLRSAVASLPAPVREKWIWWRLPIPTGTKRTLTEVIETSPNDVRWHDPEETERLLAMMAPLHRRKVEAAKAIQTKVVGTVYKRTRRDEAGERVQRAEVRFDDVAGCLRTPAGGSSRQTILVIDQGRVRSRLISSRETARLMGLPDSYELPERYNEAYHLTGDGVAVPVVRHLSQTLLLPLLASRQERLAA